MEKEELSLAEKQLLLMLFERSAGPRHLWDNEERAMYEWFKKGFILARDIGKGK